MGAAGKILFQKVIGEKLLLRAFADDLFRHGLRHFLVVVELHGEHAAALLAPSCVRSDGESNYVYVVEYSGGGFLSENTMKVKKTSVTVIERSDSTVSIQEDLSYRSIADREDRALEDGATVMEYVQ